jgi:hypothetical protein
MSSISTRSAPVTKTILPHLRCAGVKVRVRHYRIAIKHGTGRIDYDPTILSPVTRMNRKDYLVIGPRGGRTEVNLLFPDGKTYTGIANCSVEDQFNRREGIRIALERALAARKAGQFGNSDFPA